MRGNLENKGIVEERREERREEKMLMMEVSNLYD